MRINIRNIALAVSLFVELSAGVMAQTVDAKIQIPHEILSKEVMAKIVQSKHQAFVLGDGTDEVYVFSDPMCGHCRNLATQFSMVKNLRVYTFLVPRLAGSAKLAESLWCAPNRDIAWDAYIQMETLPDNTTCENPLLSNSRLATELEISMTPTFVTSDGRKFTGYRPLEKLNVIFESLKINGTPSKPAKTIKKKS